MNSENTRRLYEDYPKIFRDRSLPLTESLMGFGFEFSDGWEPIVRAACGNIQSHIDSKRKSRANDLLWNRMLKRAIAKDTVRETLEEYFFEGKDQRPKYLVERLEEILVNPSEHFRKETPKVTQLVASQMKEKFGTLSFYYYGGDDYCSAIIDMAESMSAVTCEKCGNRGKLCGTGWLYTSCPACDEARNR